MKVEDELKRKREELEGEIADLSARIDGIRKQVSAIDQVIAIYDPTFVPEASGGGKSRRTRRSNLPPVLAAVNKSQAVLEALRESERPLTSAECSCRIVERHGLSGDDPALSGFVQNVSASLNHLEKRGRVRRAGMEERKQLWTVAA